MLGTSKSTYKGLLVISLILIVAAIAINLWASLSGNSTTMLRISGALAVVALASAGYYILKGYSKNAAKYYKIFGAFFILSQLASLIGSGIGFGNEFQVMISAMILLFLLLLSFNKNLGKRTSLLICWFIIILCLADLIVWIFLLSNISAGPIIFARSATQLLMACILTLITYAKYVDKDARGTI